MKYGIRFKLTISYIALILLMAIISITFVSIFSESYILNDTQRKLGRDAQYFSEVLSERGYFPLADIKLLFQRMDSINYSMFVLDSEGTILLGLNTDAIKATNNEFTNSLKSKLPQSGAHLLNINKESYSVYIQQVVNSATKETIGYVVPFTPTGNYSASSAPFVLFFISLILAAMFAIFIGTLLSKKLTINIKKLTVRANLLKNRQFDVPIPIQSNDEISELADSIENMAKSIQEYDFAQKVFLQNASHELRTPLMSIRGYVEGFKDGVFQDKDNISEMILSQVSRLEKLVEEVLYLTKLETTEGIFEMKPIKIEQIIDEAIERVKGIAIINNITITKKEIADEVIVADGDKVATVFTNIFSNCIRFAKNEIEISTNIKQNNLVITVSDDGNGINEEDMPHLFDRFYKGQKGKNGLGLAIAKAIVISHKGQISARNKPPITDVITGKQRCCGAIFEISLPLNKE